MQFLAYHFCNNAIRELIGLRVPCKLGIQGVGSMSRVFWVRRAMSSRIAWTPLRILTHLPFSIQIKVTETDALLLQINKLLLPKRLKLQVGQVPVINKLQTQQVVTTRLLLLLVVRSAKS